MIGFLPAWQFDVLGLAFMLAVAVSPKRVLWAFTLGEVREVSGTGVTVLRWIGILSALGLLLDLVVPWIAA